MDIFPIFWINLDQSADRRKAMEEQFSKFGLTNQTRRISAISCETGDPRDIELCVTRSHLKAIQMGVDLGSKYFLVMEDNIELSGYLDLELLLALAPPPNEWGILQLTSLWPTYLNRILRVRRFKKYRQQFFLLGHFVGAKLYLVNGKYAQNIIDGVNCNYFDKGEHAVADYAIYRQVPTYIATYPLVQLKSFVSTIEDYHNWYTQNYIRSVSQIYERISPPPYFRFKMVGPRIVKDNMASVYLISQYYQSENNHRQEEIDHCLKENVNSGSFEKVILLNEYTYTLPVSDGNCNEQVKLGKRMSYFDAIKYARDYLPSDSIIIIANSDIVIPSESVQTIRSNLNEDQLYALTRWEQRDNSMGFNYVKWSQDVWVYYNGTLELRPELDIELGTCGCDNLVAKVFSDQLTVLNPSLSIKVIHHHQSAVRNYKVVFPDPQHCLHIWPDYLP